MMGGTPDFVHLDMVPPGCGAAIEATGHDDDVIELVRIRAFNEEGHASSWSGWFSYEGEPITVAWAAFEWPADGTEDDDLMVVGLRKLQRLRRFLIVAVALNVLSAARWWWWH